MFVKVVQAAACDIGALGRQSDRLVRELAPGARGRVGAVSGVSDGGDYVVVVRFSSLPAARAQSGRAQQARWWEQTAVLFDGAATFHNCRNVDVILGG